MALDVKSLSSAQCTPRYADSPAPRRTHQLREKPAMWKLGRLLTSLRKELLLAWNLLRDPRTPGAAKLVTVLALLYVVSPIDLVSDFIPVLGWIDDGVIAWLLLQLAFRFLPPELMAALRAKVQARTQPRVSS